MPKPINKGKITRLILSPEQRAEIEAISQKLTGGYQHTYARVDASVRTVDGKLVAHVNAGDMERLREYAARPDEGTWQKCARDVLRANGLL